MILNLSSHGRENGSTDGVRETLRLRGPPDVVSGLKRQRTVSYIAPAARLTGRGPNQNKT
jgi:hypothetical protein